MLDRRLAWLSVGASRTDLEAASSASLLHSIYGSQASQLPFSESESSLPATQSEFLPRTMSPAAQRRYPSRPRSSPAATLLAREQQKQAGASRPGGSVVGGRRLRPATARSGGVRPGSAAPRGRQRPSSAHPGVGGAAPSRRARPRTALGVVGACFCVVCLFVVCLLLCCFFCLHVFVVCLLVLFVCFHCCVGRSLHLCLLTSWLFVVFFLHVVCLLFWLFSLTTCHMKHVTVHVVCLFVCLFVFIDVCIDLPSIAEAPWSCWTWRRRRGRGCKWEPSGTPRHQ